MGPMGISVEVSRLVGVSVHPHAHAPNLELFQQFPKDPGFACCMSPLDVVEFFRPGGIPSKPEGWPSGLRRLS